MTVYQRLYWVKRVLADGREQKSAIHLFPEGQRFSLCGCRKPTWAAYRDGNAGEDLCGRCAASAMRER